MWTFIKKENIDGYINQYPVLSEKLNELILLETNDAYFLPRYFVKSFPSNLLVEYIGKNQTQPERTFYNFTGKLRPVQIPIIETLVKLYQTQGYVNGIVKARPGKLCHLYW